MSAFRVAAIAPLLIGVTVGIASADHVLVSRGVPGTNADPNVAVNDTTGDTLIAWTQLTANGAVSRVWTSLLKRKPDGTFRVPKRPRRVSPPQGFHSNVSVAWIPAANAYFVVWDTRRIPGAASKIMGRRLNKNGGFLGPVRTLVSDGRENLAPALQGGDPARIVYTARDVVVAVSHNTSADIVSAALNEDRFSVNVEDVEVVRAFDVQNGYPFLESQNLLSTECSLLFVQANVVTTDSRGRQTVTPKLFILLMFGAVLVEERSVPNATLVRADAQIRFPSEGEGRIDFIVTRNAVTRLHLASFKVCEELGISTGTPVRDKRATQFNTAIIKRPDTESGPRLAPGPSVFDIAVATGGTIRSQSYNRNARATATTQTLADDVGQALFLNGATLPTASNGSTTAPDAILTWLVSKGTGSEIRALAITRD